MPTIETNNLQLMQAGSQHEAIGLIAFLAHCDERYAKRPFAEVLNQIYGCVAHKQYAVVGTMMEPAPLPGAGGLTTPPRMVPVGYVIWANLNYISASLYAKGIRQLSPSEFKSGSQRWIMQVGAPYGDQETIWKFFKERLDLAKSDEPLYTLDWLENSSYTLIKKQEPKG